MKSGPLNWMVRYRIAVAVAAFIALELVGSFFVGPTTCRDGWHSLSIGHRGACSWHGGVGTNWEAVLLFFVSVGVALWIWVLLFGMQERQEQAARAIVAAKREEGDRQTKAKAKLEGHDCPECGFPLQVRTARRGRRAGKSFWGCSRYPLCKVTRPLTSQEVAATAHVDRDDKQTETKR